MGEGAMGHATSTPRIEEHLDLDDQGDHEQTKEQKADENPTNEWVKHRQVLLASGRPSGCFSKID